MAERDRLLQTIEAVHSAGLEAELWPRALAGIARAVGGVAATLETFEYPSAQITEFHSHGLPRANEIAYFGEYAARNPRIPKVIHGHPGDIVSDYMVLDERAMDRDVFYADFLAPAGYRYCACGTLAVSERESALFSVQRAIKQGHVQRKEVEMMHRLLPHVRQAYDVMRRLRNAETRQRSLERTLDWFAGGAGLVREDGSLVYANPALQEMARRGDGIRIVNRGVLEFAAPLAGSRFRTAIASAHRLRDGEVRVTSVMDFPAPRRGEAPHYVVAVRPLVRAGREARTAERACALVFVRDPLQQERTSLELLCGMFGFTPAEAALARALQSGVPPAGYARASGLSLNTVYTHLRRVKDKTGCRRQAELIARLNAVRPPLRSG